MFDVARTLEGRCMKTCFQNVGKAVGILSYKAKPLQGITITPAEAEEYMEAFRLFDKNGDGKLNLNELGKVLRTIGQNPTDAEISRVMKEADKDGKGYLTETEYIDVIKSHAKDQGDLEIELREAFRTFDRDRSGNLDLQQLQKALCSFGEPLLEDDVQEFMKLADRDGDGKVDIDEFVAIMCQRY